MYRSWLIVGAILVSLLTVVACEQLLVSPEHHVKQPPVYKPSGHIDLCNRALEQANRELLIVKLSAVRPGMYSSWRFADNALAEALQAKQNRDYLLCVEKSHFILTYIRQDKRYQQWKSWLSP